MYYLQCPCGEDTTCGTFISRYDFQLGHDRVALEQHEFWTHDYVGEIDLVTGLIEFA